MEQEKKVGVEEEGWSRQLYVDHDNGGGVEEERWGRISGAEEGRWSSIRKSERKNRAEQKKNVLQKKEDRAQ